MQTAFDEFRSAEAHWLDDYSLFRALKLRHNGAYYLEWPSDLVCRVPVALARARVELSEQIEKVCFAQFLLFRQGERLIKHAHAKGVRLMVTCPFSFLRIRATFGPTPTCSCSMITTIHVS